MQFILRLFLLSVLIAATADGLAAPVQWVTAPNGRIPSGAIVAGRDGNGTRLVLCRGSYNGGVHPGKVVGTSCNIGWGGREISLSEFSVAVGKVSWAKGSNGSVPAGALIGGAEPGRDLPVCRAAYDNGMHPGKVVVDNCNFGWGGYEILAKSYDVAVDNGSSPGGTEDKESMDSGRNGKDGGKFSTPADKPRVADTGGIGKGGNDGNDPSAGAYGGSQKPDGTQPGRSAQPLDLNAVAKRCTDIGAEQYPYQAQNQLLQRAACTYYCAYNITGDRRYQDLYLQSQRNANSLCSVGLNNCNDISPLARCNYR